jgi:hypothetical protein
VPELIRIRYYLKYDCSSRNDSLPFPFVEVKKLAFLSEKGEGEIPYTTLREDTTKRH